MSLAGQQCRSAFLAIAVILASWVFGCSGGDSDRAQAGNGGDEQWNVLLITLCSVRQDHTSLHGYHRATTPNLERLAQESYVFDHAFSVWPKTAPGFASIMTAKYGHETGIMRITPRQTLAEEHITLSDVLREQGYATAAFISTPAVGSETNVPQGFELVEDVWRGQSRATAPTTRTLAWLDQLDGDRPFFVWAHYNNAHYPYHGGGAPDPNMFVDDAYYDRSRSAQVIRDRRQLLQLDVPKKHPCAMQILRPDMGYIHPNAVLRQRPNELDFYVARFDAGIFAADLYLGQLLDGLRERELLDKTVVVVVGDHGESLGDHNYYFEHGRLPYDDTVRVVLMIRPPGGATATQLDPPVSAFAVAPTVLELLGLEPPADWTARSLMPVVRGEDAPVYVFTESGYQMDYTLAIRDNEWKLIHVPNAIDQALMRGVEYELYRWREDRAEANNLAAEQPDQVKRLAAALRGWARPWIAVAYGYQSGTETTLSPEAERILRSMGYIGGDDSSADEVPPPKKEVEDD